MKSSKFVCRAVIFVQTVSFMHKIAHGNEAASQLHECMPINVDTLGVYANTIILFKLGE